MTRPDSIPRSTAAARMGWRGTGASLLLFAALLLPGCANRSRTDAPPASQPSGPTMLLVPSTQPSYVYHEVVPGEAIAPDDHLRTLVEVIRVSAPIGSLSGSPAFWQVTSDHLLSSEQQRFLNANGLRFATIEASAWAPLKEEIERHVGVMSQTSMARGTGRAEIDIRSSLTQTLFFFDQQGRLQGRSFEGSENFWGLRFAPDPAERGRIALDLCPVVRAARRQTRVTRRNNEYEIDYTQPEAMYDIGMHVRIPLGMALVVAPTPAVRTESNSLGRAFLTVDDPAGLMEYVLVLYPRLYRLNAKATQEQFEYAAQREQQQLSEPGKAERNRGK